MVVLTQNVSTLRLAFICSSCESQWGMEVFGVCFHLFWLTWHIGRSTLSIFHLHFGLKHFFFGNSTCSSRKLSIGVWFTFFAAWRSDGKVFNWLFKTYFNFFWDMVYMGTKRQHIWWLSEDRILKFDLVECGSRPCAFSWPFGLLKLIVNCHLVKLIC